MRLCVPCGQVWHAVHWCPRNEGYVLTAIPDVGHGDIVIRGCSVASPSGWDAMQDAIGEGAAKDAGDG